MAGESLPFTTCHSLSICRWAAGWPWQQRQAIELGGRREGTKELTAVLHCGLSDCYQCCWAAFVGATGRAWRKAKMVTEQPQRREEERTEREGRGSWGWMAAGKVSAGHGEHAGSKDAVCSPCCLAVSPTVMKLNEGTHSTKSIREMGDHLWPEQKRETKKRVHTWLTECRRRSAGSVNQ